MSQSDTSSDEQQLKIARAKGWFGLAKVVVSVLVGSVLVSLINSDIQNTRLESDERKSERDFVGQFVTLGLDKDLEKRRDFAEYFYRLSPSGESRNRWGIYRDYVEGLVKQSRQKEDELIRKRFEVQLASESAAKAAAEEAASKAHAEALKLQKEATENADERARLQAELEKAKQQQSELSARAEELRNEMLSFQSELATKQRELATLRSESQKGDSYYSYPYSGTQKMFIEDFKGKFISFASVEDFGSYLLARFDRDESGVIDSLDELARIPCSLWISFWKTSFADMRESYGMQPFGIDTSTLGSFIADEFIKDAVKRFFRCVYLK